MKKAARQAGAAVAGSTGFVAVWVGVERNQEGAEVGKGVAAALAVIWVAAEEMAEVASSRQSGLAAAEPADSPAAWAATAAAAAETVAVKMASAATAAAVSSRLLASEEAAEGAVVEGAAVVG